MTNRAFNLAAHVLAAGETSPDKVALEVVGARHECLTYGTLRQSVLATAEGFRRMGLAPGARILMRLGNTPDFPIAYLAALAGGYVVAPTSAALTEQETAAIIAELEPALILRAPDVACPEGPRTLMLDDLRRLREGPAGAFHLGDAERPGYIIYTSGTSGHPRAVQHAHRAILARRMMFDGWYGLRATDRVLHAGAFNWTYTLGTGLMDPWTLGATALIPAEGTDATALPDLLAKHGATIFAAAPGVYRKLLRAEMPALPRLRHGLSAGEKLPDTTRAAWTGATGTPVFEAYGMSECSTFISSAPGQPAPTGTLGKAQHGRRVAILGADGPQPPGTPGEIAVHRSDPGLMLAYLNAPEDTAARYQGVWFQTGDMGVSDAEGYITYLGRNDDMMNAGGIRLSPIEVENVLNTHPDITSSACVELQVKADTHVIAAFYTGTKPLEEDTLSEYVKDKLAPYKRPRMFTHVEALPQGANGKLLRRRLRENWNRSK